VFLIARLENAQAFKENGNDYFKGRRFREAASFYTQGIDAKPTDPSLLEALFCNRAACNLELSAPWALYLETTIELLKFYLAG
jgi:hypothetical protein